MHTHYTMWVIVALGPPPPANEMYPWPAARHIYIPPFTAITWPVM